MKARRAADLAEATLEEEKGKASRQDLPKRAADIEKIKEDAKKDIETYGKKEAEPSAIEGAASQSIWTTVKQAAMFAMSPIVGGYLAYKGAKESSAKDSAEKVHQFSDSIGKADAAIKKNEKGFEDHTKSIHEAEEQLKKQQREFESADKEVTGFKDKIKETQADLEAMKAGKPVASHSLYASDRDMPEIDDVAKTGRWVRGGRTAWQWQWQQGPFAGAAQRYMQVRQAAAIARAWGNTDAYNRLEKQRDYLESGLRQAVLLPQEAILSSVDAGVQNIAKTLGVAIKDGAMTVVGKDNS